MIEEEKINEPADNLVDTMDVIDEILGNPKKTPEEKEAYLKKSEDRRQRLIDLERENQEWQEFKRPYIEDALEKARSDYEALKASKKESEKQKVRTYVKKSNNIH